MAADRPLTQATDAQATDAALLEEMRERFRTAAMAEEPRRARQLFDYKFSIGKVSDTESYQWSDADKSARAGRPMLTNNRIGQHIRQLKNQQQESLQSVRVSPVDNGADPEKADIRQGVIRHIETQSDADIAYMEAADQQVRMGEGFVRVFPQYAADDPDNPIQELVIEAIENRFSVYVDPMAKRPDARDARYVFIAEDLESKEYDARYPNSRAKGLTTFDGLGDQVPVWFPKGHTRVVEYFYVKSTWKTTTIQNRAGEREEREIEQRQVCWVKANGIEILMRRRLPEKMKWIPVVRCAGEKVNIQGDVDFRGVVRDAIDPQKLANYMDSATAEMIALAPKAPYIGYTGQFKDKKWQTANTQNHPFLEAEARISGSPETLPLPQRNIAEPPIQAMAIVAQRAENNLRAALGVIDVDSQERHKEQSGRAITARQRQSEMTNSHFVKNLGLMIRQVGRILDAWIPYIYDSPRVMEIIGADEQSTSVMVHAGMPPSGPVPDGVKGPYDLSIGRYDVKISTGPSAMTRRQEAVEAMTQLVVADPTLMKVMGDLWFDSMDWPDARKIGQRFKKLLPPELQEEGKEPSAQQLQQQIQKMGQMLDMLTKELEAKNEYIKTEGIKLEANRDLKQAEFAHKEALEKMAATLEERLKEMDNAAKIRVAEINAAVKGYVTEAAHAAAHEAQALDHGFEAARLSLEHENATHEAERQRQHEAAQAATSNGASA